MPSKSLSNDSVNRESDSTNLFSEKNSFISFTATHVLESVSTFMVMFMMLIEEISFQAINHRHKKVRTGLLTMTFLSLQRQRNAPEGKS